MKKLILIISTLILISANIESQSIKRFEINMMPLSIIDIDQPLVRIGFRTLISNNILISSDFGYGFNFLATIKNRDNKSLNYKLYSFRPELDYIFYKENSTIIYGGLEYLILKRTNNATNFYINTHDNTLIYFENADYLKIKQAIHLKLGTIFYFKNSFTFETYFGAGYRLRYLELSNIQGGEITIRYIHDFLFPYNVGIRQGVNITAGFKVGYRF